MWCAASAGAWVRNLYRFALRPNLAFYFRVPLEVAIGRILGGRNAIKFYEAGMDLGLSRNVEESFRIFQGRILDEYEAMIQEVGFHVIDATGSIEEQQQQMRDIVMRGAGRKPAQRRAARLAGRHRCCSSSRSSSIANRWRAWIARSCKAS